MEAQTASANEPNRGMALQRTSACSIFQSAERRHKNQRQTLVPTLATAKHGGMERGTHLCANAIPLIFRGFVAHGHDSCDDFPLPHQRVHDVPAFPTLARSSETLNAAIASGEHSVRRSQKPTNRSSACVMPAYTRANIPPCLSSSISTSKNQLK
jgi:hypothetical protein